MHHHRHAIAHQQYVNARTINLHMSCMLLNVSAMQGPHPGLSILCNSARPCVRSTRHHERNGKMKSLLSGTYAALTHLSHNAL